MTSYFSDKFNQDSRRRNGHNYSWPGNYFITIVTDAKILFFGKIINNKTCLSPAGKVIFKNWIQIPNKFPYATLDEFVIMPNHIHGIIIIKRLNSVMQKKNLIIIPKIRPEKNEFQKMGGITGGSNPMISQDSISYIIRWFKARSSYEIRRSFPQLSFAWQPRYHDRILDNDKSLFAARNYIRNNPKLKL